MPVTSKTYKCSVCLENICKSKASIQCRSCQLWMHVTCTSISDSEIVLLKANKGLAFICQTCDGNPRSSSTDSGLRDEFNVLSTQISDFLRKGEEDRCSLKHALEAIADLKHDVASYNKELRSEINVCSKRISQVESTTSAKFSQLEVENNALHRKLNRADFIIGGLPEGLNDLGAVVIELGLFFKTQVSSHDINYACYIHNKKSVLVKLNSVFLRDSIMAQYFREHKVHTPSGI